MMKIKRFEDINENSLFNDIESLGDELVEWMNDNKMIFISHRKAGKTEWVQRIAFIEDWEKYKNKEITSKELIERSCTYIKKYREKYG